MTEFLKQAINPVIIIFLVTSMLSAGLGLTVSQIFSPLRNARLLISSLAATHLVTPLIAIGIVVAIPLAEPLKVGLVLMSLAAGAEAGPKIVAIARGNVAFSVGLLAVNLVVTVISIPLVLSVVLPEVDFDHTALLVKLSGVVILPLATGLLLKARYRDVADRLSPLAQRMSTFFMLLTALLIIAATYQDILRMAGSGAVLSAMIFITLSFSAGYLLGSPGQDTRRTLAVMSGTRNASISLMIAAQVFTDPRVLLMIIVTAVLMLVLLVPAAYLLGHRQA